MHQYYVKIEKYSEAGALTGEAEFLGADTPQRMIKLVNQYKAMRYTDDEGQPVASKKMYRVTPCITRPAMLTDAEYAELVSLYAIG